MAQQSTFASEHQTGFNRRMLASCLALVIPVCDDDRFDHLLRKLDKIGQSRT